MLIRVSSDRSHGFRDLVLDRAWEQKTDRFRRAKITSDETNETIRDITLKNLSPIPIITDATPTPEQVQASQVLDLPK